MNKSANKVLSSLCYFSVFFAPFFFPLIVWILSTGDTSHNAKKALAYHISPYICIAITAIIFGIADNSLPTFTYDLMFIIAIILIILSIYFVIKNIYLGIKLLLID